MKIFAVLNDRDLSSFSRPWHIGVGVCTRPSNAKDFVFVSRKIKGSYDQRAVGREARQSGISGFESAHAHKSSAHAQELAHIPRMQNILYFDSLDLKYFVFR
jgi:hypothetical protein